MRFLGVFDTVAAIGDQFDGRNGLELAVNTEKVAQTSHVIMMHENRSAFDVIGLDDIETPQFDNIKQRVFPGAHSDGGGGYGLVREDYWHFSTISYALPGGVSIPLPQITRESAFTREQGKPNLLANLTLRWMHREAINAGAPFQPIDAMDSLVPDIANMTLEEIERELVHDSKLDWKYSIESWTNRTERTIYYPFRGIYEKDDFTYEKLLEFYEGQRELIIQESSIEVGVKAK